MYRFSLFKTSVIFAIACCNYLTIYAQTCETPLPEEGYLNFLTQKFASPPTYLKTNASGDYLMNVIIITDGNGETYNRMTFPNVVAGIQGANAILAPSGISVAACGSPTYVDDSLLFAINGLSPTFLEFARQMDKPGYINIYLKPFVGTSTAYAYYPGSLNRMGFSSITPRILAHELGHFFGLIHTFGGSLWGQLTSELVDGSNCETSGDWICDTPADPYPHGFTVNSCQYTGTVVDANGDLYTPDTENIMSYYPFPCTNHFTVGQDDRMNAIAQTERHYLRQDPNPFQVTFFPQDLCTGDSNTYVLTGTDPSGVFSGPGITNNVFDPSSLSPGVYSCTYTGTSPQGDSVLVIEALQSAHSYSTSLDTADIWQAYEAPSNLPLEQVSFRFANDSAATFILDIHEGTGTSGPIVLSQSVVVPKDTIQRWADIPLNTPLPQIKGQAYTLSISSSHVVQWSFSDSARTTPQLPSSISDLNNSFADYYTFATWSYQFEGNCPDSVTFLFQIVDPVPDWYYAFEAADPYCKDYQDIELKEVINFWDFWDLDPKSFEVNGIEDSLIRPSQLGPGTHEITFNYINVQGCPSKLIDTIEIVDYPEIFLPDTLCFEAAPLFLPAIQSNATFAWNGMKDSLFDPQLVGSGLHEIQVLIPNPIDTLFFPAYPEIVENRTSINQIPLGKYGQSFISDSSALLDSLIWFAVADHFVPNSGPIVAFHLRAGDGLTGPIMFADTIQIDSTGFQNIKFSVADKGIFLMKDSAYTMETIRLDSVFSTFFKLFQYFSQTPDVYPDGIAYINSTADSTADIDVQAWLSSVLSCGEEQTHEIYVQEVVIDSVLGDEIAYLDQNSMYSVSSIPGLNYQWSVSNGQILTGQGTSSITVMWTNTGPQSVSVQGISNSGCSGDTTDLDVMVFQSTGIKELPMGLSWNIFPNPASNQIQIDFTSKKQSSFSVLLIDRLGRKVKELHAASSANQPFQKTWKVSDLSEGMYQVLLQIDGNTYSKKLIISGQ